MQRGIGVVLAVPLLVIRLVFEAEIRAHIDVELARVEAPARDGLGEPGGQRAKDDVAAVGDGGVIGEGLAEDAGELRIDFADRPPLKGDGGDGRDLDKRVGEEQPHDLKSRVAGGADDARFDLLHGNTSNHQTFRRPFQRPWGPGAKHLAACAPRVRAPP